MPHTHVELSQTGIQGRPHDDHEHLKIHRLNESLPTDESQSHYLMAVVSELTPGVPIPSHNPGPAVAYIIEGDGQVEDESKPGEVTKLFAGDVIHVDHGSRVTFSTQNKAKFLAVSYIPSHVQPEDFILKK